MIYSQSGVLIESIRPKAMSGLGTHDVVRKMLKTCEMGSPTLSTSAAAAFGPHTMYSDI